MIGHQHVAQKQKLQLPPGFLDCCGQQFILAIHEGRKARPQIDRDKKDAIREPEAVNVRHADILAPATPKYPRHTNRDAATRFRAR